MKAKLDIMATLRGLGRLTWVTARDLLPPWSQWLTLISIPTHEVQAVYGLQGPEFSGESVGEVQ